MNHWTKDTDMLWKNTAGHHGQETEWQAQDVQFQSDCHAADYLPSLLQDFLQQLAQGALQSRRVPQYGQVLGRQAHEVVWMLRRVVEQATEWQIPCLRDGLRCGSGV